MLVAVLKEAFNVNRSKIIASGGIVLSLIGFFLPSSAYFEALAPIPVERQGHIATGILLFRANLVFLGLIVVALAKYASRHSSPVKNDDDPAARGYGIVLVLLLVAATILRFFALNDGIWYDEVVTLVEYAQRPILEIVSTYNSPNQHFLFSVLARISIVTFGEHTWSLRLPAAVFGVLSIWALYAFGRNIVGRREALLSAALLTFSYQHLWFSQNARGYTLFLFWTILSSRYLLRGLQDNRSRDWLLYAIAATLGMYSHVTMLFVIVTHFSIYAWDLAARRREEVRDRWAGLVIGFVFAGALTLQLYALVVPQILFAFAQAAEGMSGDEWTQPLWVAVEFARGMLSNFGLVGAIVALLVAGAGVLHFARAYPRVLWLSLVPALLCLAVKFGMGHQLWPRSVFFSMGFGAVIIIRGTMLLGGEAVRMLGLKSLPPGIAGVALSAAVVFVSALSVPLAYGPKQDFVGARAFVAEQALPDDRVVTLGLATLPYEKLLKTDWQEVQTLAALNDVRSGARRTWLIYTLPIHIVDAYPEIVMTLESEFEVVKQFPGTLAGGTVIVCRSDIRPNGASPRNLAGRHGQPNRPEPQDRVDPAGQKCH